MASLFDPLGFISPITIAAKRIIHCLWLEKIGWDKPVSSHHLENWLLIRNELHLINILKSIDG